MSSSTTPGKAKKKKKKTLKACNVCGDLTDQRCSVCKTRVYCSRECQKSDWKDHRNYCARPPTEDERWQGLRDLLQEDFGGMVSLSDLKRKAAQPKGIDECEAAMQDLMQDLMHGADDVERYKWPTGEERMNWTLEGALDELEALPVEPNYENFVYSWSCMGEMDPDTGELKFMISCCASQTGKARVMKAVCCRKKPSLWDLEHAIYASMAHPGPFSGPPHRPSSILLAHRWGEELFRAVLEKLRPLGIYVVLETKQAAIVSARDNDTDPDGYNWRGAPPSTSIGKKKSKGRR